MSEVRIAAETRTELGKGAARRVRRAAQVPAVLYGHGQAPRHLALPGHELMLALKHDPNVLLTLVTDAGDQLALPRSVVRDPIKGHLEHLDLIAVDRGERVTVDVPVVLTGDAESGVLVEQQATTVTVEAEATHLPESLEVSLEGLSVGEGVAAGAVGLPEGVTLAQDAEQIVVQGLAQPTEEQVDADLAATEQELGAGAAGVESVIEGTATEGADIDGGAGIGDAVPETEAPATDGPA
ncbi:MAG: 50S ribosomal protein L25/general stress protein Ctc [Actinomycetota bacterium]|nr:50S ribosomal protein L25/general stress protein Ctc [Actinomycetota bacterium]